MKSDLRKIGIITQVRTGSTRLPGKVLQNIIGKPMIYFFLERLKRIKYGNEIIVATTTNREDDTIVRMVQDFDCGVQVYRGHPTNLLDRHYRCARSFGLDVIVRITSDNPLVDHAVADRIIEEFLDGDWDYCANNFPPRTYPHGLDVEVCSMQALEKAWKEATEPDELEHATPYIRKNPDKFMIKKVVSGRKLGDMRWTVDYPEDFEFVKRVYEGLYTKKPDFDMDDVIDLISKEPDLGKINKNRL